MTKGSRDPARLGSQEVHMGLAPAVTTTNIGLAVVAGMAFR